MKFSGKVNWQWANEQILAIWVTDPDPDPYRDTGKTCLGGGMHCPRASSLTYYRRKVSNLRKCHGALDSREHVKVGATVHRLAKCSENAEKPLTLSLLL